MDLYALIELDMVDSTNNWAKREKASFSYDRPTFIVASGQTGGRGRGANSWVSPRGQNLYLTLTEKVRPSLKIIDYSLIAPLAMKHLLKTLGIQARIKWPNDLIVGQEKICGILIEGTTVGSSPWIIVGIGLNVNMNEALLRSIDQPATSLHRLLKHQPTVHEIQNLAIEMLCEHLSKAQSNSKQCREEYCAACEWMVGMEAVLETPQGELSGTIEGFSPEGYIRLRTSTEEVKTISQAIVKRYSKR
jgi:BirA family transcriptional regulator, biotin operon repressor / biotin---[acetyl-CoA-carboxylase] ligase